MMAAPWACMQPAPGLTADRYILVGGQQLRLLHLRHCASAETRTPRGAESGWGSPHSLVDVVRVHACYRFSMAVRTSVKNVILI